MLTSCKRKIKCGPHPIFFIIYCKYICRNTVSMK